MVVKEQDTLPQVGLTVTIKIGDKVKSDSYGTGTVEDLPNDFMAWVRYDQDPDHWVRGVKTTKLERAWELSKIEEPTIHVAPDNRLLGPGGAPTRATTLPDDAKERKNFPIASGVLDYFPDALVAISLVSKIGNDQHNPGLPLRWTRDKSTDHSDTFTRHFLQRGTKDVDGQRHTAKAAWRILALLQTEIESEQLTKE